MKTPPTIEQLHRLLRYDLETGLLWWRACPTRSMKNTWQTLPAGKAHSKGYIGIRVGGFDFLGHRIAWALHHGEWPNQMIDHRNTVRTDNRIENLRLATRAEQNQNASLSRRNKSGFKGVCFLESRQRWVGQVTAFGKVHSRYFLAKEDAIRHVAAVRERLHQEFANHG